MGEKGTAAASAAGTCNGIGDGDDGGSDESDGEVWGRSGERENDFEEPESKMDGDLSARVRVASWVGAI